MKMLFAAVALTIASPALAQAAPAGNHANHAATTGKVAPAANSGAAANPHAGHNMAGGMAGMMDCCKKKADGTMAGCAMMNGSGHAAGAAADPHAGHKTGQ